MRLPCYDLLSFGIPIVRKATQRLGFYEFDNLKRHLPHLRSMAELITSERYLGQIKLEVSGLPKQIENLTPDEKLDAATQILDTIAGMIASDKVEFKGTKSFKPYKLREKFTNKTLNFALDDNGDREFGRSMNDVGETAYHLDLSKRDWYVFDDCFGTSEEKLLILFIDKRYGDLKKKYSDVYLIRNEKHFKLYNFDDGRPWEPDFVLYLIGKEQLDTMHYQVFIEPKGTVYLKPDEWKEKFLVGIKACFEIEQLFTNKKYVVWGLPFYNSEQCEEAFAGAFQQLLE
jgi:type III restriction enzyme